MEFSVYLNGRHMAFIVCEIGPRKTGLICRIHFMMEILQLYLFSHMQSSYRWPGLLLQMTDFWVSITFSHVRLLMASPVSGSVVWGPVAASINVRHSLAK